MRVFISYAYSDIERVKELAAVLSAAGHETSFDLKLLPGQDWDKELLASVASSDLFVYALTPVSAHTDWCLWSLAQAIRAGKPVLPVLLYSAAALPAALGEIPAVDFSRGATSAAALHGDLNALAAVIPPENAPAVPPQPRGVPAQARGTTDANRANPPGQLRYRQAKQDTE